MDNHHKLSSMSAEMEPPLVFECEDDMSKKLEKNAEMVERLARDKLETLRRTVHRCAQRGGAIGRTDPDQSRRQRQIESAVLEYLRLRKAKKRLLKKMIAKGKRKETKG